jgi:hypothetical protein
MFEEYILPFLSIILLAAILYSLKNPSVLVETKERFVSTPSAEPKKKENEYFNNEYAKMIADQLDTNPMAASSKKQATSTLQPYESLQPFESLQAFDPMQTYEPGLSSDPKVTYTSRNYKIRDQFANF